MTFVFVPGAWLGAWCWEQVIALLLEAGQDAVALSLTGLGDRAHLLSREVGLETHVADVVAALCLRDVSDAVLVGHSYGGTVITAAADQVPDRVRWLVYLDGSVPRDGESNDDVVGADIAARLRDNALHVGAGWLVPPPSVSHWQLPQDRQQWVQARLTAHPLRCFQEPVRLRSQAGAIKRAYLRSSQSSPLYGRLMDRAREAGWWCRDLPGGHYPMLTSPHAVASALLRLAEVFGGDTGEAKHHDNPR